MEGVISMSIKELSRLEIIDKVIQKRLKQAEAADILNLSVVQIKRLVKRYKAEGAKGLISKKRAMRGNHKLSPSLKTLVGKTIQELYSDFGPTLAHEKLVKVHGLDVSISTVRMIMITNEVWVPKRAKRKRIFQHRERRSKLGELIQLDGSHHAWFEDRGPKCCLIFTMDDATGKIFTGRFCASETTWDYFYLLREHVSTYGRPRALYSDKHGVFKINHRNALTGTGVTQFGRAMKTLDIEPIFANTPQAKGRIERMNQTLQDRLVKELRLQKISTFDEANAFLPGFLKEFNQRFAVIPKDPTNAHRELLPEHDLDLIFIIKEHRVLSKNLTFQYANTVYQVHTTREEYALRKAQIEIHEKEDKSITAFYKGKKLLLGTHIVQEKQSEEVSSKELNAFMDELVKDSGIKRQRKPSRKHPWKRHVKRPGALVRI